MKKIKLNTLDVKNVIEDYKLMPYKNIWHFSFNEFLLRKSYYLIKNKNEVLLYSLSLNIHSPFYLFVSKEKDVLFKKRNFLLGNFNKSILKNRPVYWYLRINKFENFLYRREKISNNPKKHFPSSSSYEYIKNKINAEFYFIDFNRKYFIKEYNKLKPDSFHTGEEVLSNLFKEYPGIEEKDIKLAFLSEKNEIKSLNLLLTDKFSISLINPVSIRNNLSYGLFSIVEIVKYASNNNFRSFDAGVSLIYGNYKEKIFLDSLEVYQPRNFFEKILFKLDFLLN